MNMRRWKGKVLETREIKPRQAVAYFLVFATIVVVLLGRFEADQPKNGEIVYPTPTSLPDIYGVGEAESLIGIEVTEYAATVYTKIDGGYNPVATVADFSGLYYTGVTISNPGCLEIEVKSPEYPDWDLYLVAGCDLSD